LYPSVIGALNFIWEYKIILPQGYKIDHLPESRNFFNGAGKYTSSYEKGQGYILVKRNLIINNNVYSPEEYPAFKELIYKPINDARSAMVLDKL
jgi:glucan biosynthesis protein